MSIREDIPELWNGLEKKFWLWMSKQGAYSNLQIELREYGLKYNDMIEAMSWSYVNDHYKTTYHMPFTAFLLFEQTEPPIYSTTYWEKLQAQWNQYARGKTAT